MTHYKSVDMLNLNKDVLNIIFKKLDIRSQLRLRSTCKRYKGKLDITDLYNINNKNKLTDNIVIQYPKLLLLDASYNIKITDATVAQLKQLHTLDARNNPNI